MLSLNNVNQLLIVIFYYCSSILPAAAAPAVATVFALVVSAEARLDALILAARERKRP